MLQEVFMNLTTQLSSALERVERPLPDIWQNRENGVAMIEKSNQMYGGTCINEGCIPSKSLIIQADKQSYGRR